VKRISRPSVTGSLADVIRRLRESGVTYQAIADALNAEKVPTLRGATPPGPPPYPLVARKAHVASR